MERPEPRVATGIALNGLATACIDVSDGLMADLGHICFASKLKAVVDISSLPGPENTNNQEAVLDLVLTGGDDYELCFTIPEKYKGRLSQIAQQTGVSISVIGRMCEGQGIEMIDENGNMMDMPAQQGYRHF